MNTTEELEHTSYFAPSVEHGLAILDHTGDTKMQWDVANKDEVEHAKKSFDTFTKDKKYMAYKTDNAGNKAEQIREFDPTLSRIILVAPMVGG